MGKEGQSEGENVFNVQDFLEVLAQLHSPNHAPHGASQLGRPFGLIQVSLNYSTEQVIMQFLTLS